MSNSADGGYIDPEWQPASEPESGPYPMADAPQPEEQAPYGPEEEIELEAELRQEPTAIQPDHDHGEAS